IVGFPGESDADFRETLRLCEDIRFASAFTFKYSERPGTPAANAPDQVPEAERHARLLELQALVETHRQEFNHATVGIETEVLVEREGRMPGQMAGKSPWLQPVQFDTTEHKIGDTVAVRIDRAGSNSLFGQLAASAPAMA
ncbi:MAG: TRAM domain-containing protein, partial [Bosea sp. (in: a-proteobacteria)]